MNRRPTCANCHESPAAVNRHVNGKVYYRKLCDKCIRAGKKAKTFVPAWVKSGYKKKPKCEKCGFVIKFPDQANVFHLDGDNNNVNWANLRTICANCTIEISHGTMPWKPATSIQIDF